MTIISHWTVTNTTIFVVIWLHICFAFGAMFNIIRGDGKIWVGVARSASSCRTRDVPLELQTIWCKEMMCLTFTGAITVGNKRSNTSAIYSIWCCIIWISEAMSASSHLHVRSRCSILVVNRTRTDAIYISKRRLTNTSSFLRIRHRVYFTLYTWRSQACVWVVHRITTLLALSNLLIVYRSNIVISCRTYAASIRM